MHRKVFLALVVACCLSVAAYADITITPGNWSINPAAGQTNDAISATPIAVLIGNDGNAGSGLQGINLVVSIGDQTSGTPVQPIISALDLIGAGTIFNGNNTGQGGAIPPPGAAVVQSTTTSSGHVVPDGTLAFLTFDATGVAPGTYELRLFKSTFPPLTTNDAGTLPSVGAVILELGSVTVVPEPGTIVLGLFAAAGLCAVVIRRRRKAA